MKDSDYRKLLSGRYDLTVLDKADDAAIFAGELRDKKTGEIVPIRDYIPRFVDQDNYAGNFGLQWNTFRTTQLDSQTGLNHSKKRLLADTGWNLEDLKGKLGFGGWQRCRQIYGDFVGS